MHVDRFPPALVEALSEDWIAIAADCNASARLRAARPPPITGASSTDTAVGGACSQSTHGLREHGAVDSDDGSGGKSVEQWCTHFVDRVIVEYTYTDDV